jgi:hypothetical protein
MRAEVSDLKLAPLSITISVHQDNYHFAFTMLHALILVSRGLTLDFKLWTLDSLEDASRPRHHSIRHT